MADLKTISTASLRSLIDETEATLDELNAELVKREEAAQHAEIDSLDQHMKNAELSVATIRDFISALLRDMRSGS